MTQKAAPRILNAIRQASARTGVDFAYLMEKAAVESSFNPAAKARGSSATGLFQFIESTWLRMVKAHGEKYGLGDMADKIDANGKVASAADRKEILALRKDPQTSAMLAAEFALENKNYLVRMTGEEPGATELYLAHFMGAGGAAGFLNAMKENPMAPAADLFPKAARANRNVFYDKETGAPRTLASIYAMFDRKFSGQNAPAAIQSAQAPAARDNVLPRAAAAYSPHRAQLSMSEAYRRQQMIEIISSGDRPSPETIAWNSPRPEEEESGRRTQQRRRSDIARLAAIAPSGYAMNPADIMIMAAAPSPAPSRVDKWNLNG